MSSWREPVAIWPCGGLLVLVALAPAAGPEADREIRGLVKQLGSEAFHEREAAAARLTEIGEPALAALHQAVNSDDPEVRRRARDIVAVIDHRLYGQPLSLTGHTVPHRGGNLFVH
jgi:hypothetical protein